jgi:hypothetical protein
MVALAIVGLMVVLCGITLLGSRPQAVIPVRTREQIRRRR